jgi:hypothetical protein
MHVELAQRLMDDFAESTGLTGNAPPRRYLWTDAFAVCNLLGLHRRTGSDGYLQLARTLVDQVHRVLGRHRSDDSRKGWISGLPEDEGERHPTRGGLRIGKTLNERRADEPLDSYAEWDRDGQYFHYLTEWMHALLAMSRETGENDYLRWAIELAVTAHRAFTFTMDAGRGKRMVWKMSIDLGRPLVSSMGAHDPLDGLITCLELQVTDGTAAEGDADLTGAIEDFDAMCTGRSSVTDDPLGIGGLLDAATRLAQLVFDRGIQRRDLLCCLLRDAGTGLRQFAYGSPLERQVDQRLAFRELGLSIGLHAVESIEDQVSPDPELTGAVCELLGYRSLAGRIEEFWSKSESRGCTTWTEHRDINMVMLATSLAPEGYLRF